MPSPQGQIGRPRTVVLKQGPRFWSCKEKELHRITAILQLTGQPPDLSRCWGVRPLAEKPRHKPVLSLED